MKSIRGFTIAMTFGSIFGMYSSVFIGGPILIYFGLKARADDGRGQGQPRWPSVPTAPPSRAAAWPRRGRGFYPYQAVIDGYGNGGFRFAGMSHRGSLLCLPSGMHAWEANSAGEITGKAWRRCSTAADEIDVLLVGLGTEIVGFDKAISRGVARAGIIVEAIATGGAVRTYNILLAEKRAVAAALIAVENAR